MDGEDEGLFNHAEADVLMVSFMINAVRDGKKVTRILSDDTDVFVILIFWVRKLSIKKGSGADGEVGSNCVAHQ